MKKSIFIFLLSAHAAHATGTSGLNIELLYVYGLFVFVVLLVVGTHRLLQFIYNKIKAHREKLEEHFEHHEGDAAV